MCNMNFPVYGVIRNYHGQCEYKYVYTGAQLLRLENEFHHSHGIQNAGWIPGTEMPVTEEMLAYGYEDSFASDDTYTVIPIHDLEELMVFIYLNDGCDVDDPMLSDLRDWTSTYETECMFTGEKNATADNLAKILGITVNMYTSHDERYNELLLAGMPEDDFDLNWPANIRYGQVLDSLNSGKYGMLRKAALNELTC